MQVTSAGSKWGGLHHQQNLLAHARTRATDLVFNEERDKLLPNLVLELFQNMHVGSRFRNR